METSRRLQESPRQVPAEFELEPMFVDAADPFVAAYLELALELPTYTIGDVDIVGGQPMLDMFLRGHPGCVVKEIGLVAIGYYRTGEAICVSVTSGEVYFVPFLWTNDEDPSFLQGGYDPDTGRTFSREPLSIEAIEGRGGHLTQSLEIFLEYVEEITLRIMRNDQEGKG